MFSSCICWHTNIRLQFPLFWSKNPLSSNFIAQMYFFVLNVANFSHVFNIYLSSLVRAQLCKDVRSKPDIKFCMEMSNGLLPFYYHHPLSAYCPSFSFSSPSSLSPPFFFFLSPPPFSLSLQCPWCLLLRASPDLLWVLRGSLWVAAAPLPPFRLTFSPSPHGWRPFLWGQYHYGN